MHLVTRLAAALFSGAWYRAAQTLPLMLVYRQALRAAQTVTLVYMQAGGTCGTNCHVGLHAGRRYVRHKLSRWSTCRQALRAAQRLSRWSTGRRYVQHKLPRWSTGRRYVQKNNTACHVELQAGSRATEVSAVTLVSELQYEQPKRPPSCWFLSWRCV